MKIPSTGEFPTFRALYGSVLSAVSLLCESRNNTSQRVGQTTLKFSTKIFVRIEIHGVVKIIIFN